jgi:DNA repair and recombination RAD54-like protein
MEDENEVLSASDPSDSSDEYTADQEEEEEEEEEELEDSNNEDESSLGPSAPSDEDRKSKNVDALLRYHLFC